MKTFLIFDNKKERKIPDEFKSNDNRNPEELVRFFLNEFTKKGNKVFDPFAGLGTTLVVSEELGRIPYGIEFDSRRAEFIKSHIKNKNNFIKGNSLKLNSYKFPKFDFCFTSPPYMSKDETENPLSGNKEEGNYDQYLRDINMIFLQLKQKMKKDSFVVIEVSNLKGKEVTTLAWDIAKQVSRIFKFEGEIVVGWKGNDSYAHGCEYGYGYDHSYCLVFRNE